MIISFSENPEATIREQQSKLLANSNLDHAFALHFNFLQYYLAEPKEIELLALVYLTKNNSDIHVSAAIFSFNEPLKHTVESLSNNFSELQLFAQQQQVPWLNLSAPLTLEPVKISKPWGQEIWYTGIEARGQSNVIAQGFTTPLPWVLALMPEYLAAGLDKKIILLKTLDPLLDEVRGDLYFELHETKQEVYIVTHVDERAWKNNIGAIRLGFSNIIRAQYDSDEKFKAAYLNAVKTYEKIRRAIDGLADGSTDGLTNGTADGTTNSTTVNQCPPELVKQEQQAREYMNNFSAVHPLQVGDVVKVPCYVPHALQHGVRTLEFQTPVYERKILSFAQKVLTQSHWDTEEALAKALCNTPEQKAHSVLFATENESIKVEEIVSFDDFRVVRISLTAYTTYSLPAQNSYGLIMPIANSCKVLSATLELNIPAETAMFIPHTLMSNTHESLWLSAGNAAVQILIATVINHWDFLTN